MSGSSQTLRVFQKQALGFQTQGAPSGHPWCRSPRSATMSSTVVAAEAIASAAGSSWDHQGPSPSVSAAWALEDMRGWRPPELGPPGQPPPTPDIPAHRWGWGRRVGTPTTSVTAPASNPFGCLHLWAGAPAHFSEDGLPGVSRPVLHAGKSLSGRTPCIWGGFFSELHFPQASGPGSVQGGYYTQKEVRMRRGWGGHKVWPWRPQIRKGGTQVGGRCLGGSECQTWASRQVASVTGTMGVSARRRLFDVTRDFDTLRSVIMLVGHEQICMWQQELRWLRAVCPHYVCSVSTLSPHSHMGLPHCSQGVSGSVMAFPSKEGWVWLDGKFRAGTSWCWCPRVRPPQGRVPIGEQLRGLLGFTTRMLLKFWPKEPVVKSKIPEEVLTSLQVCVWGEGPRVFFFLTTN